MKWAIKIRIKENAKMVKKMDRYFEIFPVFKIINNVKVRKRVQIVLKINISIWSTPPGFPITNIEINRK